jgi:hypothetical protein
MRPEHIEERTDGTVHFIRRIDEYGARYLRVIAVEGSEPLRIITVFFDRRFREL